MTTIGHRGVGGGGQKMAKTDHVVFEWPQLREIWFVSKKCIVSVCWYGCDPVPLLACDLSVTAP